MSEPSPVVIALSRQKGCGGSAIGQEIASRLRLRYIDRALLRTAAEYLVATETNAEQIEERVATWWSRLGELFAHGAIVAPAMLSATPLVQEADVSRMENRIVEEIAERYRAVIVGRGACHTLRGRRGVFRAFLHAPEEWRVARFAEQERISLDAARGAVRAVDRERASFARAFAGLDWTYACQYDMSIDVAAVGPQLAIE